MAYAVAANGMTAINMAPGTIAEEVLQNVMMILSTIKTTAPLCRDFGLSTRFLDAPMPVAESLLVAEIYDAIETYEPRAEIVSVSFDRDGDLGKIIPRLEVAVHG